jgi:hypothetical protein
VYLSNCNPQLVILGQTVLTLFVDFYSVPLVDELYRRGTAGVYWEHITANNSFKVWFRGAGFELKNYFNLTLLCLNIKIVSI